MLISFLSYAVGSITSSIIIESVSAGVGVGITIYTTSKGLRSSSRTRKK